jgi:metallo-beta-lactamase family protein
MAQIQFLGATRTVTGSKYVLDVSGSRAMVDCGLFQGLKDLRQRNWEPLPISPASINWGLLTHAHIDHTGYLPRLVHDGFTGPIYGTPATNDLLAVLLPDSARLQEEDADYANRKGFSRHQPALPLYTERDARAALKQTRPIAYNRDLQLGEHLTVRYLQAGHILGSSFISATISEVGRSPVKVLFSGDVGRYDEPILNDPTPIDEADYLLVESTYGNRVHEQGNPKDRLAAIIGATVARGGKVIIPAFAVGRTQQLIYYLRELENEGRIPVLPVAVDSPMAVAATRLYSKHTEDHDLEMRELDEHHENALATRQFTLVHGRAGSKALDAQTGPGIIISASGMATGGRVLHHLAKYLSDPASCVVFVGFQAAGTRGARLQHGEREIKIHGEMIPVNAQIESMGSLSAHADSLELMRWMSGFKRPPKTTFLVHGEPTAASALAEKVTQQLGWHVVIPEYKQVVELI